MTNHFPTHKTATREKWESIQCSGCNTITSLFDNISRLSQTSVQEPNKKKINKRHYQLLKTTIYTTTKLNKKNPTVKNKYQMSEQKLHY